MRILTGFERTRLRGLAHHLHPIVQVGKNGVTDALIASVDAALDEHEHIKLKFIDFKTERKALAKIIATRTESSCVGLVGNVAIFFREAKDPEQRKIRL